MAITIPNTFVANTLIKSADMNANFTAVANAFPVSSTNGGFGSNLSTTTGLPSIVSGAWTFSPITSAAGSQVITDGTNVKWGYNPVSTKTGTYTLQNLDNVIFVDAASATFTVSLPVAASFAGKVFTVCKITTVNGVSIAANGTDAINLNNAASVANFSLIGFQDSIALISDGVSKWNTVGKVPQPAVSATYIQTSTAGSVINSNVTVAYSSKVFDTHNAYNTTNGNYTVPVPGKYKVSGSLLFNTNNVSQGTQYSILVAQNGATVLQFQNWVASTGSYPKGVSIGGAVLSCGVNDTIQLLYFANWAGATLATASNANYVSIVRVGD